MRTARQNASARPTHMSRWVPLILSKYQLHIDMWTRVNAQVLPFGEKRDARDLLQLHRPNAIRARVWSYDSTWTRWIVEPLSLPESPPSQRSSSGIDQR